MLEKRQIKALISIYLFLSGAFIVLFSTQIWGSGISHDSMYYIGAARGLSSGQGLMTGLKFDHVKPMVHYPPFFSGVLSLINFLGPDPMVGARLLNAILFGSLIVLIGNMVYSYQRSLGAAVVGSLLVLSSRDLVEVHCMVWSEPLSNFLIFSGLYLLSRYLEDPKPSLLAAVVLIAGLEGITKFAGIPLIVAGSIGLIFYSRSRKTLYSKVYDAFIFSLLASLPLMLWLIRNYLETGRWVDRVIIYHQLTHQDLEIALRTLTQWSVFRHEYLILLFLAILYIFQKAQPKTLPRLMVIFILSYGVFLMISKLFIDRATPVDLRILSPVFIAFIVFLLCIVGDLKRSIRNIFYLLCWVIIILSWGNTYKYVMYIHNNGMQLSSPFIVVKT